jgi:hypothetical protein
VKVRFDPVLHEYTLNETGERVRSVTGILTDAGLIDNRWYSEEARDRGSAVHELCERYASGIRADDAGRELADLEYVNALAAWMRDFKVYALKTECVIYNQVGYEVYGGTFDLLALIAGRRVLVDLKTGAKAKWHYKQLAGYGLGKFNDDDSPVNPDALAVLYLKANGKYVYDIMPGLEMVAAIRDFKGYLHD